MTFDQIYTAFYALFRADSDVPSSTDAEYIVGMRLANEAINYWANYEGTYWNELHTMNQFGPNTGQAIAAGTRGYALPSDFGEIGGYVQLKDPITGTIQAYIPRIDPQERQFQSPNGKFAWIANNKIYFNPLPTAQYAGMLIEYPYYKKPTYFTSGTSTTEMKNPYFIVHRMLAMQFRAARNPYYSSALRDAEDAIKKMQTDNNSGSWNNPPELTDNSGDAWGGDW